MLSATNNSGTGMVQSFENVMLEAGTYYLWIDLWPTPEFYEFDFFIEQITCPGPAADSVDVFFVGDVTTEVSFWSSLGISDILWDTLGFEFDNGILVQDAPEYYEFTGLTPETDYEFYLQDICDVNDSSEWIGPFFFSTTAACPLPANIDFAPESWGSSMSWDGGVATMWDIEYGMAPYTFTGVPTIEDLTEPWHYINMLDQMTEYEVYVRADCGADTSDWAGPFSFTTLMAPMPNPTECEVNIPTNDDCLDVTITVDNADGMSLGNDIKLGMMKLILEHDYDGDVDLYLESPNGVTVELSTDNGGSGTDYGIVDGSCEQWTGFTMTAGESIIDGSAPFLGEYLPEGDFADFNDGSDPNGEWVLHICDDYAGLDYGTFIHITS
jgi:subtilisin-like proprotein convertase family protein